jgi:hypothetical protein
MDKELFLRIILIIIGFILFAIISIAINKELTEEPIQKVKCSIEEKNELTTKHIFFFILTLGMLIYLLYEFSLLFGYILQG